jgi:hypothetical protein
VTESYGERVKRLVGFANRRRQIMDEWNKDHPEGLISSNLKKAQAFMKKRERELKKGERP